MSVNITEHMVQQWTSGITHLAQQKKSRLRRAVRVEQIGPGDRAYFDHLGTITMNVVSSRHADTDYTDTPHSRRMVTPSPFKHADLVDKDDKIRTLNDPTNDYVIAFARGAGRAMDQVLIDAAFATARTGVAGAGTETWASLTAAQTHGTGSAMTMAKIIESNRLLRAAENDPDDGFFFAVTETQIANMLNDTTFTSADYNSIRALMTGTVSQFMGFDWIATELIGTVSSEDRCMAWWKPALLLAVADEPEGMIDVMPGKNYSTQVFYSMDIGATRMSSDGIVECLCTS